MTDITVYGFPLSTFVRTVRMTLVEKGLAYDLEPVAPHSPEIAERHPWGKVPAFQHGAVRLFETQAICRYIDEMFDGPALQPSYPGGRARMAQWISAYCDNAYRHLVQALIIQRLAVPRMGGTPDEDIIAANLPDAKSSLGIFDKALAEHEFLAGGRLTLADLFLAPLVFYLPMTPEGQALLPEVPNLQRWYEIIAARDSFKQTVPDMDE